MKLIERLKTNWEDVRRFGPGFALRHLARLRGDKLTRVAIDGMSITMRAGESDVAAVRQVFGGEYDISGLQPVWQRITRRYDELLAAGQVPVIVDAGANIGAASLWFGKRFPKAAVVAVEPDPDNARILRENLAGLDKAHVLEAAIGAEAGFVALKPADYGWAVQTERAEAGVPVVTIDDAVAAVPGGAPFIAKIDIEGFEKDLFSDNLGWIAGMVEIVIEPHDWMLPGEYTSHNFQRAMAQYPFEMFHLGENIVYVR